MTALLPDSTRAFAAALSALEEEIPWEELGTCYCHEGGESFFPPEQVVAIRESGLLLASDLGAALERLEEERAGRRSAGAGRSLYLGAALAELVPALCEALVLGRTVDLRNLPGREPELLNAALGRAEARVGVALPRIAVDRSEPGPRAGRDACDHLWMTSVLTDPDTFPALHDALYDLLPRKGRRPPEGKEPTGRGNLPAERRRARSLVRAAVARIEPPALVTTTDEELELVRECLLERGLRLEVPGRARLSAVVGDPVRTARVRG